MGTSIWVVADGEAVEEVVNCACAVEDAEDSAGVTFSVAP